MRAGRANSGLVRRHLVRGKSARKPRGARAMIGPTYPHFRFVSCGRAQTRAAPPGGDARVRNRGPPKSCQPIEPVSNADRKSVISQCSRSGP